MSPPTYSLDQLCALTALPLRTVRYYIQIGLLDKPMGEKRGAYYTQSHLDQLMRIVSLTQAGVSLDRVRHVLHGGESPVPPRVRAIGSVDMRSHIHLGPGLELQVSPEDAQLSSEQLRQLIQAITHAYQTIQDNRNDS